MKKLPSWPFLAFWTIVESVSCTESMSDWGTNPSPAAGLTTDTSDTVFVPRRNLFPGRDESPDRPAQNAVCLDEDEDVRSGDLPGPQLVDRCGNLAQPVRDRRASPHLFRTDRALTGSPCVRISGLIGYNAYTHANE